MEFLQQPTTSDTSSIDALINAEKLIDVQEEILLRGVGIIGQNQLRSHQQIIDHFKNYFANLYFDVDRKKCAKMLCPVLSSLVNGELEGQKNCFLGIGVKGVGKSQFFIALGQWAIQGLGDKNCAFLYRDMGVTEESSIYNISRTNMRKIIHNIGVTANWDVPSTPWSSINDCWQWLLDKRKRIFVVLDEFEKTYSRVNTCGLLDDLCNIGNRSGPRPIVVVLLGSSSYLRSLCFCIGDGHILQSRFEGYNAGFSLNNTKFLPIQFGPILTVATTQEALRSLGKCEFPNFDVRKFCKVTRGEIRNFANIYEEMKENTFVDDDLDAQLQKVTDNSTYTNTLKHLWTHVDASVDPQVIAKVISFEIDYEASLDLFSCPQQDLVKSGISIVELHSCSDNSVIRFDGSGKVKFLHPTDIEICLTLFHTISSVRTKLSTAEQVSLQYAYNCSAEELNEMLVAESLCVSGLEIPVLGKLTFTLNDKYPRCFMGCVRLPGTPPIIEVAKNKKSELFQPSGRGEFRKGIFRNSVKPAIWRKEWPDELGGSLIASFKVTNWDPIKFIVVRAQVKLGLSTSSVDKNGKTPFDRMTANEDIILAAAGYKKNQVIFVNVLWTSRPTNDETDSSRYRFVIDSNKMMQYWSDRVKKFVNENGYKQYGANEN